MSLKDGRIKLMNQILSGIKVSFVFSICFIYNASDTFSRN